VGVRAGEVAAQLTRNRESVRLLRSDLVRSANATTELLREDAHLRHQVASVVLWGPAAAPGQQEKTAPPAEGTRSDSTDAPLSNEHPSSVNTPEDTTKKPNRRLVDPEVLADLRAKVDAIKPLETR